MQRPLSTGSPSLSEIDGPKLNQQQWQTEQSVSKTDPGWTHNLRSTSCFQLTKHLKRALKNAQTVLDYEKVISALLAEAQRVPDQFNLIHLSIFFHNTTKAFRQGLDSDRLKPAEREALLELSRIAIDLLTSSEVASRAKPVVTGQTITWLTNGLLSVPAELRGEFMQALAIKINDVNDFSTEQIQKTFSGLRKMSNVPKALTEALIGKVNA